MSGLVSAGGRRRRGGVGASSGVRRSWFIVSRRLSRRGVVVLARACHVLSRRRHPARARRRSPVVGIIPCSSPRPWRRAVSPRVVAVARGRRLGQAGASATRRSGRRPALRSDATVARLPGKAERRVDCRSWPWHPRGRSRSSEACGQCRRRDARVGRLPVGTADPSHSYRSARPGRRRPRACLEPQGRGARVPWPDDRSSAAASCLILDAAAAPNIGVRRGTNGSSARSTSPGRPVRDSLDRRAARPPDLRHGPLQLPVRLLHAEGDLRRDFAFLPRTRCSRSRRSSGWPDLRRPGRREAAHHRRRAPRPARPADAHRRLAAIRRPDGGDVDLTLTTNGAALRTLASRCASRACSGSPSASIRSMPRSSGR